MVTSYIFSPNVLSNLESFSEFVLYAITLDLALIELALKKKDNHNRSSKHKKTTFWTKSE